MNCRVLLVNVISLKGLLKLLSSSLECSVDGEGDCLND